MIRCRRWQIILAFRRNIFIAEMVGTFGLVFAATGSITYDGIWMGELGLGFIALMHMLGLWLLVSVFGVYSMAHFNPAVTLGFAITGHARWAHVPTYLVAQTVGALLGSIFVLYTMGYHADLGLNRPGAEYDALWVFGVEASATIILMGAILLITATRVHGVVTGLVVGGVVAMDVWFFGPVSGASMNPVRSIAPAVVTGIYDHLWFYIAAPLAGAMIPAWIYRYIKRQV